MTIRLLILALIFLGFSNDKEKVVTGKLIVVGNPEFYAVNYVLIIIKTDNNYSDTVITNASGQFSFSLPNDKSKNIDIFCSGAGIRTTFLQHINSLTSDTTNLDITIPIKYRRNIFGKARCPKCGKADLTYKIRYGDAPIYTMHLNSKGDTTYSPIHNGIYEAGTDVTSSQDPKWFCDRDKIEF